MHVLFLLYVAILFVIFSPDVLFRFPVKGSKTAVLFVHAGIFFVVLYFSNIFIYHFIKESLVDGPSSTCIGQSMDKTKEFADQSNGTLTSNTSAENESINKIKLIVSDISAIASSINPNTDSNIPAMDSYLSRVGQLPSLIDNIKKTVADGNSMLAQAGSNAIGQIPNLNTRNSLNQSLYQARDQISYAQSSGIDNIKIATTDTFNGLKNCLDNNKKQNSTYSTNLASINKKLSDALADLQSSNQSKTNDVKSQTSSTMDQLASKLRSCATT